jgi:hypothetical protein
MKAVMAKIIRSDTNECVGMIVGLHVALSPGTKTWPFHAWRHPDGKFRDSPPQPQPNEPFHAPPPKILDIPVRNGSDGMMEILVPLGGILEFLVNHQNFRVLRS